MKYRLTEQGKELLYEGDPAHITSGDSEKEMADRAFDARAKTGRIRIISIRRQTGRPPSRLVARSGRPRTSSHETTQERRVRRSTSRTLKTDARRAQRYGRTPATQVDN